MANVGQESHVEHAVGFVEDKSFDRAEIDIALVHQIDQPAGRCDQDIDAVFYGPGLRVLAHAAENDGLAQGGVISV